MRIVNVEPMKAETLGHHEVRAQLVALERSGRFIGEVKYDGERAIITIHDGRVTHIRSHGRSSRHVKNKVGRFPEVTENLPASVPGGSYVLDGEIGYLDASGLKMDVNILQRRAESDSLAIRLHRRRYPLTFVAFDLLEADAEATWQLSYHQRRERLHGLLKPAPLIQLSQSSPRLVELYDEVCAAGGEGIMLKTLTHAYQPGTRSRDWMKAKAPEFEEELHIVGLLMGEGKRARLGSLVLGRITPQGDMAYVCKAGSGLSDEMITDILAAAPELRRQTCPCLVEPKNLDQPILTWLDLGMTADVRFTKPVDTEENAGGFLKKPRFPIIHNVRIQEATP